MEQVRVNTEHGHFINVTSSGHMTALRVSEHRLGWHLVRFMVCWSVPFGEEERA